MSPKADAQLQIHRLVPASPERVFRAWTDPDEIRQWWGPKNVECLSAEVDLREGGQYRIANQLPDGVILWISGEFIEIRRPHKLVYTWTVETADPQTERVSVQFEAHASGTRLTLTHEQIPSAEMRDDHERGWIGCLDGLVGYLAGTPSD